LEQKIQKYCSSDRRFFAVISYEIALALTLQALCLEPGDEVLVPSFAPEACLRAIVWNRLKPMFCDIHPETFTMDPDSVARRVTRKSKVILAVHTFGVPCDALALETIARHRRLRLVFDAAEAFGAQWKNEALSEFGDAGVFSFSGDGVLHCGDGAVVYFRDSRDAARFDPYRRPSPLGFGVGLPEFQALIAGIQVPKVEQAVSYRNAVAALYRQLIPGREWQAVPTGARAARASAVLLLDRPEKVALALAQAGIETQRRHPAHHLEADAPGSGILPVTETVAARALSLPLHNEISREDVEYVAAAFLKADL
jgi:dTDP-4-amino-4,6-dideoxygalactose transaminase